MTEAVFLFHIVDLKNDHQLTPSILHSLSWLSRRPATDQTHQRLRPNPQYLFAANSPQTTSIPLIILSNLIQSPLISENVLLILVARFSFGFLLDVVVCTLSISPLLRPKYKILQSPFVSFNWIGWIWTFRSRTHSLCYLLSDQQWQFADPWLFIFKQLTRFLLRFHLFTLKFWGILIFDIVSHPINFARRNFALI